MPQGSGTVHAAPHVEKAADSLVPQKTRDTVGQHGRVEKLEARMEDRPAPFHRVPGLPGAEEGLGLVHVEEMDRRSPVACGPDGQVQDDLRLAAAGGAEKHPILCLWTRQTAHPDGVRHVSSLSRKSTSRPLNRSGCSIMRKCPVSVHST
ncbi:hypothetical protein SDC9_127965 [bioreactor metagenome]|uniref:Uncharacterized protein n=1 Tax=bioreactor metagenome TaxID=1076179 RepID=A0A645CVI0_9ZZZZ